MGRRQAATCHACVRVLTRVTNPATPTRVTARRARSAARGGTQRPSPTSCPPATTCGRRASPLFSPRALNQPRPSTWRAHTPSAWQIGPFGCGPKNYVSPQSVNTSWATLPLARCPRVTRRTLGADGSNARNMERSRGRFSVPWDLHPSSLRATFAHNTDLIMALDSHAVPSTGAAPARTPPQAHPSHADVTRGTPPSHRRSHTLCTWHESHSQPSATPDLQTSRSACARTRRSVSAAARARTRCTTRS